MVQIANASENFALPFEQTNMWSDAEVKWIYFGKPGIGAGDLAVNIASSGYYRYLCATLTDWVATNTCLLKDSLHLLTYLYQSMDVMFGDKMYLQGSACVA